MSKCPNSCKDQKLITDDQMGWILLTIGHTVCLNCGSVIEENAVVAEVQFSEKSNGATVSDGFFIGAGQTRVNII